MQFFVEGIPVGKGRPRFMRNGHAYTPAKTRTYENLVRLRALEAMHGDSPFQGALCVTIVARFPVPVSYSKKRRLACLQASEKPAKKPDIDNLVKAILDGLNGIVFDDDAQVVQLSAAKNYAEVPGCEIFVSNADD
ncbi:RusA family crossover junction endodeoxyribonuclease [uncultured Sutterella sp.]|uniref:RusA family crossover junction endodeoxyribonuclease n=1 Tax=uncultured Sutterella sp. TaxID=286133 RepID=UPI0026DAB7F8|nr:RusA family crossover junction endodeoxyribonuclease [uncultured Sutterella sp.]